MALGLRAKELADKIGCSLAGVRKWTLEGMPYEPAGRLRFYDLQSVRNWLRERDDEQRARRRERKAGR
jgi:phage terminase Nu1 subunit (DNA packaging protein)